MSRMWERAGLNINWFPGHMASAARKVEQRLKVVDMVIEVRDARVPLCSRCGRLEELIQNKRRIIVMNKSDLIGAADQERWARHFAQQGQAVAFTSANKGSRIGDLMPQELLKRGLLARADRMLLFMIIGIPNTGKSTMINALRRNGMRARRQEGGGGNVAETGARPGVTRHVSTVQFCSEPPAFLIDTPGIMHTAMGPEDGLKLALTGAIKENLVDPIELADYLLYLLNRNGQVSYVKTLGLREASDDIDVVLHAVGVKMGFKVRSCSKQKHQKDQGKDRDDEDKDKVDTLRSAQHLIKTYRAGALGKFVLDHCPQ